MAYRLANVDPEFDELDSRVRAALSGYGAQLRAEVTSAAAMDQAREHLLDVLAEAGRWIEGHPGFLI